MDCRITKSALLATAFLLIPTVAQAQQEPATDSLVATGDASGAEPVEQKGDKKQVDALLDMSLEELLSQQVTSVAKKSGRVADSAAAVTVITQEDIRRSSARTVPDLLRMVPGMEVAEVQSSATSVSARGFTSRFAANLLVMVDGAAIYSTSISGMFWDQALVPLQDIERIEVIRGPGGSLWGSNAVNGIVNIITKQSVDTQGLRVDGSIGNFDRRLEVGFGRELNENLGFRVYGDYRSTRGLDGVDGKVPGNSWKGGLAGIRFDYAPTEKDNIVVLGELSSGKFKERFINVSMDPFVPVVSPLIQNNKFHTRHVLARWKRSVSEDFDISAQVYYNNLYRTEFGTAIDRDLYDASVESRLKVNDSNELNFGVAGRISSDNVKNTFSLSLPSNGAHNVDRWVTGYIQDEITLIPDQLKLTIGSKFEKNNFTGFEIQPSARIFYRANPNLAVWASVSRAVRTPLLIQREMVANVTQMRDLTGFPSPIPSNSTVIGSKDAKSESVVSFEAGIRGSLAQSWSYDVAAFVSNYDKITTGTIVNQQVVTMPVPFPPYVLPIGVQTDFLVGNDGDAKSKGIEILTAGPITNWWKMEVSYSYLDLSITATRPATVTLTGDSGSSHHQIRAKSSMNLAEHFRLDTDVHYVSKSLGGGRKAYTDLDVRGTYQVNPNLELSVVGSNLLKKRRLEFYQDTLPLEPVYVPRSAFIEARARF